MANRRRRILTGCLVLLGVILVAAILGLWYLSSKIGKEGELPQATVHPLLRGDEIRQFSVTLDVEDEGQRALLKSFLSSLAQRDLPPEFGAWRTAIQGVADGDPRDILGPYSPVTFVSLTHREGDRDVSLTSTSFSKGYEVIRWLVQPKLGPGDVEEPYRDQTLIVQEATGLTRVFLENHLVHATSVARAKQATDQFLDKTSGQLPDRATPLLDRSQYTDPSTDLWMFHLDPRHMVQTLVVSAESPPLSAWAKVEDMEAMALAVDFVDGSVLHGNLVIQFPQSGVGPEPESREQAVEEILRSALTGGLTLSNATTTWDGTSLIMETVVEGTDSFLSGLASTFGLATGPGTEPPATPSPSP